MPRKWMPIYVGIVLLLVGLLFTAFLLGPLRTYTDYVVWGLIALLALGGLALLAYTLLHAELWWYFLPAFLLLSMAAIVYLGVERQVGGRLLAGVLFLGLGMAHLAVFLGDRAQRWWAWISAGSFLVLTLALVVSEGWSGPLLSAFLFVGMSVVFFLLYAFTPSPARRWWMVAFAATLLVVAALTFSLSKEIQTSVARFWPLTLIAAGVAFIVWGLVQVFQRPSPVVPAHSPPSPAAPSPSPADTSVIPVPEVVSEPPAVSPEPAEPSEQAEATTEGP